MPDFVLSATTRHEFGKGAARRLRRDDQVPAVVYGHGVDPLHLALPGHDTMLAVKHRNALVTLEFDGRRELALAKHVQRHAIRGDIEHVDFLLVRRGEVVMVDVPVHTVGEVVSGTVLNLELPRLQIRADATALPERIDVDVEGKDVGTVIHAGELTLPEGSELVTDPDAVVVTVVAPQLAEEAEAEGEAEPGAAAAAVEGDSA
jgi:large subunit ribosomal protein L25